MDRDEKGRPDPKDPGPSAGERNLVSEACRGSREAFQKLVVIHAERAFWVSFSLLGNKDDAGEATQEAFLRAYQHIRGFKGKSSFYTWFYRILSRTCYERVRWKGPREMRRARSLEESTEGRSLRENLPDPSKNPCEVLIDREEQEVFYQVLRKLSPEEYEMLSMRTLEGFSYEEIALALGCPIGTVMSRLYRARMHLKKEIAKVNGAISGGIKTGDPPLTH